MSKLGRLKAAAARIGCPTALVIAMVAAAFGADPRFHLAILGDRTGEAQPGVLEADLKAHAGAAVKMIVSHRPSWIIPAAMRNPEFPLHKLAKRYGVQYVIAGHVHQLIRIELGGVVYLSMPSAGGHLRLSKAY